MANSGSERSGRAEVQLLCEGNLLRSSLADFTSLNLCDEDVSTIIAPALIRASWRRLDLSENAIGPGGAQSLAQAIRSSNLQELCLSYNSIGDEGGIALARALPSSQIKSFDIEGNEISDDTVVALADILDRSPVCELYLSHNRISDTGAIALCPNIGRLRVLDLFSNNLTDQAVLAVSEVLPPIMTELYLGENIKVSDASIIALSRSLITSNVRTLGLMRNSITDVGLLALFEAAKLNCLSEIHLSGNPVSKELWQDLERVLLTKETSWFRTLILLCSIRDVPRLSPESPFRFLPCDIIRRIATAMEAD